MRFSYYVMDNIKPVTLKAVSNLDTSFASFEDLQNKWDSAIHKRCQKFSDISSDFLNQCKAYSTQIGKNDSSVVDIDQFLDFCKNNNLS